MSPKIVDKEEKQRAIALASVDVFGEKGFERTRMEDVAKAAGVGKGTIYEYFKNKDELMEGAVAFLFADMAASLMPDDASKQSAIEMLTDMLQKAVASIKSYLFAYRFLLEYMIHTSRKDPSKSFMGDILRGYRQWLSEVLRKGISDGEFRSDLDTDAAAAAIAAWVDGAVFHWYTLPDTVSLETMGDLFIEMTINGLRTRALGKEGGAK